MRHKAIILLTMALILAPIASAVCQPWNPLTWWECLFDSDELIGGFTVGGNSVYLDASFGLINVTPHTCRTTTCDINIEVMSKVDDAFCNITIATPLEFNNRKLYRLENVSYEANVHGTVTYDYTCPSNNFNYTASPKYAWCWEDSPAPNGTAILIFSHRFDRGNLENKYIEWDEWEKVGTETKTKIDYVERSNSLTKISRGVYKRDNVALEKDKRQQYKIKFNVPAKTKAKYNLSLVCSDGDNTRTIILDPWIESGLFNETFDNFTDLNTSSGMVLYQGWAHLSTDRMMESNFNDQLWNASSGAYLGGYQVSTATTPTITTRKNGDTWFVNISTGSDGTNDRVVNLIYNQSEYFINYSGSRLWRFSVNAMKNPGNSQRVFCICENRTAINGTSNSGCGGGYGLCINNFDTTHQVTSWVNGVSSSPCGLGTPGDNQNTHYEMYFNGSHFNASLVDPNNQEKCGFTEHTNTKPWGWLRVVSRARGTKAYMTFWNLSVSNGTDNTFTDSEIISAWFNTSIPVNNINASWNFTDAAAVSNNISCFAQTDGNAWEPLLNNLSEKKDLIDGFGWRYKCNGTKNHSFNAPRLDYFTASIEELTDLRPSVPTIIYPVNNAIYSIENISLQVSSGDVDNDTIIYLYYINGSLNASITTNHSYKYDQGFLTYINLTVGAYDGQNFSDNTSIVFALDVTGNITFTFLDEITQALLDNTTITVELFSDLLSANHTTTNGTLYTDLLNPSNYTIRYSGIGYSERFYFLTLTNRSYSNLTLYLINDSLDTDIDVTVYDNTNKLLEDAYITALRYNELTNSYFAVEMAKTNFEGATLLHLQLNTEYYKFFLYYPYSILKKTTSPTYILENSINFRVSTYPGVGENFYNSVGVDYDLTFNNLTNNFRLTYSDTENVFSSVSLKVYQVDPKAETFINSTSITTSSGTLLVKVPRTNSTTYVAKAVGTLSNGDNYQFDSETRSFIVDNPSGLMGLFAVFLLTIVFAFIMKYSLSLGVIMVPIPMLLGSIIGLINLEISIPISLEIAALIVAIILYKEG